jgi:hypothetical protein
MASASLTTSRPDLLICEALISSITRHQQRFWAKGSIPSTERLVSFRRESLDAAAAAYPRYIAPSWARFFMEGSNL